jgi:hypothetical protein
MNCQSPHLALTGCPYLRTTRINYCNVVRPYEQRTMYQSLCCLYYGSCPHNPNSTSPHSTTGFQPGGGPVSTTIQRARSAGLAVSPWGVFGAGKSEVLERMRSRGGRTKEVERRKWQHIASLIDSNWEHTGEERNVRLVLEDIAKEVGASSITGGERISRNSLLKPHRRVR